MKEPKFAAALLAASVVCSSADITINAAAPDPLDVIAQSTAFGSTGSRIFDIDANDNHGRGNRFLLTANADTYEISSVTIVASGTQVYDNDSMTLFIYEGTSAEFNSGTGHTETSPTYYEGTTVTPLAEETFTLTGSPTAGQYVTFELTTPLVVAGDTDYGFFFTFDQGDGTNTSFFYRESGSPSDADDGRTSVTTTGYSTASSRQMNYYISGSEVDTGIINPTLVLSETLIEVGSSIDLNITYDVSADTASLTTPSGTVDLKVEDAADASPNDGVVVVNDSPAADFTYQVTLTKAGEADESASAEVLVIDPSAIPSNAFSSAILADSPLFYYRYEEAVDSPFLADASGNGHHATDIIGNITLGAGPGGMQNAANSTTGSAISVPATSDMAASFTFVSVLNLDNFNSAALGNVLAMANGTGNGRSILYHGNGGFQTFIDGGASLLTDSSALTSGLSCLVHAVYDADPDDDAFTLEGEMRIYINGSLYGIPTVIANGVDVNNANWVLCSNKNLTSQSMNGWIDETAIFEAELTDAQIAAHATAFFSAGDPLLGFVSDVTEVPLGTSVELQWKTSDTATAVSIDSNPVDGAASGGIYTATFSPTVDTTYTIEVAGPGGPYTATVDIVVTAAPLPLDITSISTDQGTPPMVTIEFTGPANSSFDIQASANLSDDFPDFAGSASTDAAGIGSQTFPGVGDAEFYRLETQ
ncbi:MAG: LamG-like jellyroll fold domain-containing protein [Roseibacillus sp.]